MMKGLLTAVLVVAAAAIAMGLFAQAPVNVTRLDLESQARGQVSEAGFVWVTKRDGTLTQARIGQGLELVEVAGQRRVLQAVSTAQGLQWTIGETPLMDTADTTNRTFNLQAPALRDYVMVYRNGLRVALDRDYTLPDSQTIVFSPYYSGLIDTVLVDYARE